MGCSGRFFFFFLFVAQCEVLCLLSPFSTHRFVYPIAVDPHPEPPLLWYKSNLLISGLLRIEFAKEERKREDFCRVAEE